MRLSSVQASHGQPMDVPCSSKASQAATSHGLSYNTRRQQRRLATASKAVMTDSSPHKFPCIGYLLASGRHGTGRGCIVAGLLFPTTVNQP